MKCITICWNLRDFVHFAVVTLVYYVGILFCVSFCYCSHAAFFVIKTPVKVFCRNFVPFPFFDINLVTWCVYVCVHTLSSILYLLVISVMNYKITPYFKFKYKNY